MCISPITIRNPFYDGGHSPRGVLPRGEDLIMSRTFQRGKDHADKYSRNRTDQYIQVPCGNCIQCTSMRQAFINQRIQMESLRSHLFFFTLTYNDRVRFTNIKDYNIPYPHYDHVKNMFKHLRRDGYKFRYWIVSEYGTKRKRPHYHGILAIEKSQGDYRLLEVQWYKRLLEYWSENIGTKKEPIYVPLLDLHIRGKKRTYDFHYIEPIMDHDNDVSFYVSKYILKYDSRIVKLLQKINLDPQLTEEESSILTKQLKPRSVMSKDFGSYRLNIGKGRVRDYVPVPQVCDYIHKCLKLETDLPQFFDMYTGQSSLLSPFYRKLIPNDWIISRFERLSVSDYEFRVKDIGTVFEKNLSVEQSWKLQIQHKRNLMHCEFKYID